MLVDLRGAWGVHSFLYILKLAKSLTISCVVISVCGVMLITCRSGIFLLKYKYILVDISKMSPDLEIIMMVASILEKSKLICMWCYCLWC